MSMIESLLTQLYKIEKPSSADKLKRRKLESFVTACDRIFYDFLPHLTRFLLESPPASARKFQLAIVFGSTLTTPKEIIFIDVDLALQDMEYKDELMDLDDGQYDLISKRLLRKVIMETMALDWIHKKLAPTRIHLLIRPETSSTFSSLSHNLDISPQQRLSFDSKLSGKIPWVKIDVNSGFHTPKTSCTEQLADRIWYTVGTAITGFGSI
ncbi:hypothetical protein BKA69DRAFT_1121336 [Paraphysoderma sedebokerense]|nr:hypothetical protein BKA69DRAFT_1121336 [Paraphysoderma sedebokerense]